jgi:hypothetical protein
MGGCMAAFEFGIRFAEGWACAEFQYFIEGHIKRARSLAPSLLQSNL